MTYAEGLVDASNDDSSRPGGKTFQLQFRKSFFRTLNRLPEQRNIKRPQPVLRHSDEPLDVYLACLSQRHRS